MMTKLSVVASLLLSSTLSLSAACNDLYISEYIEGGSYNKAIELYNPNDTAIDLSAYSVELYSNGSETPTATYTLSGSVSAKDVFVLSHASASAEILAQTDVQNSSVINFNGDDAFVLKKNDVIIDAIGQIGFDPGSAWTANGVSTKDNTLVRIEDAICDTDAYDTFDPSAEWTGYPKDTFDYIGAYGTSDNDDNETDPEPEVTLIHTIQGDTMSSPMVGQSVTIEGVVVGSYMQNGGFKGFFVQEEDMDADTNPATSEGIFVYCPNCPTTVTEGNLVKVSGNISEYQNLTEISASDVTIVEPSVSLPTAVSVQLPVTSLLAYESVEGMLVNINAGEKPLVVNDNYTLGRYGTFSVGSERLVQFTQNNAASAEGYSAHQDDVLLKNIIIDDGSSYQNPYVIKYPTDGLTYENTLRAGYTVNDITGVMDERYSAYTVQPLENTFLSFNEASNPRTTVETKGSDIRVSSFNVLNYFNTFENCTYGVDGAAADCRGAENEEEFIRQRVKIINAMLEIDADVFGLMEIENDGYDEQSALADLVNGLNEASNTNNYRYVKVDEKLDTLNALGTDAIKVALIYNKKRVHPVGIPHAVILDENDKNRPSLIQTFKSKKRCKRFVVSVNHFKSKGSACDDLMYNNMNDVDMYDGQGNCNLTRVNAANVLTDYIETNKKLRKEKNIILLGDFNAYAKEDPIQTIENKGFTNVLANEYGTEAYSYVFDGEVGTLDYIFATQKLLNKIESVTVWHSNTDEPIALDYNFNYKTEEQQQTLYGEGPYRASDHDQVIVDIKL